MCIALGIDNRGKPEVQSVAKLGERLRELKAKRGLTSTALAYPRYSVSYISQIERGLRNPSTEAIEYFARRLGVSARYLATGVPDDVTAWLKYGIEEAREELHAGQAEKAESRIRAVLQTADDYQLDRVRAQALPILGEALSRIPEMMTQAIATFEEALKLSTSDLEAGMTVAALAKAHRAVGDLNRATELVETFLGTEFAVPLDVSVMVELHSVLISLYFERGDMCGPSGRPAVRLRRLMPKRLPPLEPMPIGTQAGCWPRTRGGRLRFSSRIRRVF
jgi:transcriptional regulator with XRE-family HTH domain